MYINGLKQVAHQLTKRFLKMTDFIY